MSESKAFSAVLKGRCPRCREGEMFKYGPLAIHKVYNMHEHCPVCGLRYELEPGFFYGAMYISYAFSVAIMLVSTFVLYFVFNDPPLHYYLITVAVAAILLYPFNLRYSKILFLHVFGGVDYDPKAGKE
jgi:uncharacterized protein (DUF983 family)